jgi:pyrroline-5-carboxylate reductase
MIKLGFIGCGNMGEAMVAGAIQSGYIESNKIIISTKTEKSGKRISEKYDVILGKDNADVAKRSKILILAVKPNMYKQIIDEIGDLIPSGTIVMGIAPSFTINKLKKLLGRDDLKIVRAMPNVPSMVGSGIAGISFDEKFSTEEKNEIINLFKSFGDAIEIKENLMKTIGSVTGSSPAFIYMLIEAMAEATILMGIPAKDAYKLAAKAVEGTAKMVLESDKHPAELRDNICSAGGTTIEGVISLEKNGFKGNIIEAMIKSAEKFQKMENE